MSTGTKVFVVAGMVLIGWVMASGWSFMGRIEGVLTPSAAAELGLLPEDAEGAFGPTRVWFARRDDGRFDYVSAWPLIGAYHAGVRWRALGNGVTPLDLVDECIRIGKPACELEPGPPAARGSTDNEEDL